MTCLQSIEECNLGLLCRLGMALIEAILAVHDQRSSGAGAG